MSARLPAAPLRLLWPRHTRKHVAQRFGVAVDTAKGWLADGVPADRRAALADAIEAELDRFDRETRALEAELDQLREGPVPAPLRA